MARYKNISADALVIPQVGKFDPGEEFETEREILNKNIQLIEQAAAVPDATMPVAPVNSTAAEAQVATEGGSN